MHDIDDDGELAPQGKVVGVVMLSCALASDTGRFGGSVDKLLAAGETTKNGMARSLICALEAKAEADGRVFLVTRPCAWPYTSYWQLTC